MPPRPSRGEDENTTPIYVYDLTLAEVQEHFRETKYFTGGLKIEGVQSEDDIRIPLLQEVFDILDRQVLINIEVKTPKTVELRPNYDSDRLIRHLHEAL